MSERSLLFLLEDMLEAADKIKRYTVGMDFNSFSNDEKTIDAVTRNFEIIGEAANRISPEYRIENNQIPWDIIRGFRNRIVHEYFGIDYEIVWNIIENDLDHLVNDLKELL